MEEDTIQETLYHGDYRFQIVERNEVPCLHVMIDPGDVSLQIFSTHIPLEEVQKAMKHYLAEQVFQHVGTASMCWEEIPKGTFDSTQAREVGEGIMRAIKQVTGYDATNYTRG